MSEANMREEIQTIPDGRSLPVHVLVNSTAARRFLVTNPGRLLREVQRPRDRRRKAPVQWLAVVRLI